jgi:putative transcriptional regulator
MLFSKHPIVYFIVSAIRFSTLEAICDVLDCQPGDILEFQREKEEK